MVKSFLIILQQRLFKEKCSQASMEEKLMSMKFEKTTVKGYLQIKTDRTSFVHSRKKSQRIKNGAGQ